MIERLQDLRLFVLIVDRGSLTAAGREIGLSPGAVSLRLALLERQSNTHLLRRTTRRLQLTEAGEHFYRTAKRVLDDIDELQDTLAGDRSALKGQVRVSAPVDIGRNTIAGAIDTFVSRHPQVAVSLVLSDSLLDLNAHGIDLSVRYGRLPDSNLQIRRISSNRRIPVASAKYLDRAGRPKQPRDLVDHNCMCWLRDDGRADVWPFEIGGKTVPVKVTGDREANDGDLLRRWAIEGLGIAFKSAWDVAHDIRSGQLEPLLAQYCPPNVDLQIVLPPISKRPRRVTAVADEITAALRDLDRCLGETAGLASQDSSIGDGRE